MKEMKYQKSFVENVINKNFQDQEILNLIIPIGKISPEKVLQVYVEDYQYRMLETMQSNFESIWMLLGDEEFKKTVFDYIVEHPSHVYDLNQFGNLFPSFLSKHEIPLLFDLANFELAYWKVFHAPTRKITSEFNINEEILNSHLVFDDSIELFSSEFDVFEIFKNRKNNSEEFLKMHSLEDLTGKCFLLLYKTDSQVQCFHLTKSQFSFFNELKKNNSILDVINLELDITQEEMLEMFKFISSSLLTFLKEK